MKVTAPLAAACLVLALSQSNTGQTSNRESTSNTDITQWRNSTAKRERSPAMPSDRSFYNASQPDIPDGLLAPLDQKFVSDIVMSDNAVITMGRIASQRAALPSVRDFAEEAVEHSEENHLEMTRILAEIGAKLPDGVALNDQFVINGLQDLTGKEFDQVYIRQKMGLQAILIDAYKDAEKNVKDKRLRRFAKERRKNSEEQYQSLRALDNISSPGMSMVIRVDQ